ncbi:hypothetical protein YPPY66_2951 [Yersinia pestis PY-66]|nr:hypothetical protein YPPY02_2681 [Yersinia pestis PY-02]EIR33563.1 hypothetical protein YPPY12_2854 [Yersinia pestis PY-12]EIS05534.1 hypothetical protein YPPY48_2742 [Yersinia pestis PY-48]EIS18098.1 hypothetical protein YPPY53_2762 [Yersinia pestis PY-53]EIS31625.1 hypothetical protein YPPY56_2760 [Yersinia pestis PY-56]EIS73733.1 hypothetical protein YPPY66_2951 [Yersinia pestis PY-66]EIS76380.1 hypothetical protein YPPY71_2513 [Yersinia pestis PY-71]EIS78577.1 hypothetical protein YPP
MVSCRNVGLSYCRSWWFLGAVIEALSVRLVIKQGKSWLNAQK